jgi:haloacetate dehalogenase
LLVLWGDKGVVHRLFDPVSDWREVTADVRGRLLSSGHYLAEKVPKATLRELLGFLSSAAV